MLTTAQRYALIRFIVDDAYEPNGWCSEAFVDDEGDDANLYVRGYIDIHHLVSKVELWLDRQAKT